MDLPSVVRENLASRCLPHIGATIVVGVSGGADSLCLLHVLKGLQTQFQWCLHVAHLNHCLRRTESDEDMVFVALLAMDWGIPCTIEAVDIAGIARRRRQSLEETARQVRYGFLADVALQLGATIVVVGHNADDQSETVLMHMLRGTGLVGLRGMLPSVDLEGLRMIRDNPLPSPSNSRIELARPLLAVPRAEIENYCRAHNLAPRFDRSNLDVTFSRNRLRRELLPLLETYNPNIKAVLRRTADVAATDYELLATLRDETWSLVTTEESEKDISFDLAGWRALPLSLQRATIRQAAYRLRPQLRDVDFVHIQQAVQVARGGSTGAQVTLPQGLHLTVGYETLRLTDVNQRPPVPDWPLLWHDEPVPVAVPGKTELLARKACEPRPTPAGQAGGSSPWWLEVSPWNGDRASTLTNTDRWLAYLDADELGPQPALRRRRPGDRFQPLGMSGRRVEVADFMINAKVPRHWRGHIPLLVHKRPGSNENEEIAWLVGWRIDERVKVTPRTRRIIRLRWFRDQQSQA